MEPAVIAALITAAITLVVLIVTQGINLRQARLQGEQARLAQLRDIRRDAYADFLCRIKASVEKTRRHRIDGALDGIQSRAEVSDPWEIISVLPVELNDALQQVQLVGEATTAAAALELESITRTYAWDWSSDLEDHIPGVVRIFTEAARGDLGVAGVPRKAMAADTRPRAVLDEDTIRSIIKDYYPDDLSAARRALDEHVVDSQPGALLPTWVDGEYLTALIARIRRFPLDRDSGVDSHGR